MAKMLIQSESLTAIADEIRELSGTTEAMGLDAMASTLNTENTNFQSNLTTQDNLISQIQTALQNKASASESILQTKTVTPTTSAQNVTPDSGYDGLSNVTVNAIPSTYVQPTTTKAATTYTPTTSDQTIAAGTYCSGIQTIKGDANLIASNIKSGISIFGVNGNYTGSDDDLEDVPSIPDGENTGSSSSLPTVGASGFMQSTTEGSVIYAEILSDKITTSKYDLGYFTMTKKYRHPFSETLLANTPIVILTSGTITMPAAEGYTATLIASGTGYAVYQYIENDNAGSDDPDMPSDPF